MGNILIDKGRNNNAMKAFDSWVEQNPELMTRNGCLFENKLFKTLSYKSHSMNLIIKMHLMRKQISQYEMNIHENNFLYMQELCGNRQKSNLLPYHKLVNFNDKCT